MNRKKQCVKKIKACKQMLSELKKYENIKKNNKIKHVKITIIFLKSKKKVKPLDKKGHKNCIHIS